MRTKFLSAWLLLISLAICQAALSPLYEVREKHDRDGTGVFYMGREIAHVCNGDEWLERPNRDQEEKTDVLVEALKLKPGEIVADVGAGTGFISRQLAQKVGTNGIVYAEEIQQSMLDVLTNKAAQAGVYNIKP